MGKTIDMKLIRDNPDLAKRLIKESAKEAGIADARRFVVLRAKLASKKAQKEETS